DVAEPLRRVVMRALAPDPDARFASAAELRQALASACPPPADARARIGAHVKTAFAEELREIERKSESVRAPTREATATADSTRSTFVPLARTRATAPKRSFAIGGAIASAATVLAIAVLPGFRTPSAAATAPPACTSDDACGAGAHCTD